MRKFIRLPSLAICLIALVVLASAAAYAWNRQVRQAAPKVFYEALAAGLTTPGITCRIQDKADASRDQTFALDLASGTRLMTTTTLRQSGSRVTVQGIHTGQQEYIRYTDISTTQKGAVGRILDFKAVLNIWGRQAAVPGTTGSLYDQTAYGGCAVPLADLEQGKAAKLVDELRRNKVFRTDFAASTWKGWLGDPVRTYQVTIEPVAYAAFMRQVAEAAGSDGLDTVEPDSLSGQAAAELTFEVAANQPRIQEITYAGGERTITFTDHGVVPVIDEPKATIPAAELERRLQAVK